jgi:hypothetical protein
MRKRASRTIMNPAIAPTAIPAFAPMERPGAGDEDGVGELGRTEAPELIWVVELPGDRELAREDAPTEDAAEDKDVDICEVVAELIPELITELPVAEAIMLGALEILDEQAADSGKSITPFDPHT